MAHPFEKYVDKKIGKLQLRHVESSIYTGTGYKTGLGFDLSYWAWELSWNHKMIFSIVTQVKFSKDRLQTRKRLEEV